MRAVLSDEVFHGMGSMSLVDTCNIRGAAFALPTFYDPIYYEPRVSAKDTLQEGVLDGDTFDLAFLGASAMWLRCVRVVV